MIINAINKGDTLMMTPDQAKWFTENYKNFYPKFKKGGGVPFKSDKSTRQESDNTYVEKPRVEEPRERTVNVAKLSGLDEPDWFRRFKEIKTRKYQSGGSFTSADILMNSTQQNTKDLKK